MLRRTLLFRLADGPLFIQPLITEFDTARAFHQSRLGYLQGLYEATTSADPFSPVLELGLRYMVSGPVTIGKKCLRTPFLIDTGACVTMIHTETYRRFGVNPEDVQGAIKIGHLPMHAQHNPNPEQPQKAHLLGYLNLLGADFLRVAVPDLTKYLSENISKFQPPLSSVIVTGADSTFRVTPKHPFVMDLKQAIKENKKNALSGVDSDQIIIKSPDGKVLGDKDPLHAGVEYQFELPAT